MPDKRLKHHGEDYDHQRGHFIVIMPNIFIPNRISKAMAYVVNNAFEGIKVGEVHVSPSGLTARLLIMMLQDKKIPFSVTINEFGGVVVSPPLLPNMTQRNDQL